MDSEIKKRIDQVDNTDAVRLYFRLLKILIDELGFDRDNPKLSLTIPKGGDYFVTNLNSRYVLVLTGQSEFGFMIRKSDFKELEKEVSSDDFGRFTKQNIDDDYLAYYSYEILCDESVLGTIVEYWLAACREYEPQMSKSSFRKHHNSELYELALDESILESYLKSPKSNTADMEFFKKEDLEFFHNLHESDATYRKDNPKSVESGKRIKNQIFDKTNYWAKLVCDRLPDFDYEEDNGWNVSGHFKKYSWARLYLKGLRERKYFVTVGVSSLNESLVYKFDCQREGASKLDSESVNRFDEFAKQNSRSWNAVSSKDLKQYDWERLVNATVTFVNNNLEDFKLIHSNMSTTPWQAFKSQTSLQESLNIILYGPPGTGKTFNTVNHAISIIENTGLSDLKATERIELRRKFESYKSSGQIDMITFHQSLSYEDFIEGIKPVTTDDSPGVLEYKVTKGIFRQIIDRAKFQEHDNFEESYEKFVESVGDGEIELQTLKHRKKFSVQLNSFDNCTVRPKTEVGTRMVVTQEMISHYLRTGESMDWKPYTTAIGEHIRKNYNYQSTKGEGGKDVKKYVLIIDEINRGNIAQIFGELITLIEPDKRTGNSEAAEVLLPYSKEKFSVPANLYIIGTMNTADRSVEALDTALRRRFSFIEMPPVYDLPELNQAIGGVVVKDLLFTINKRLEKLLSKDHLIGHSYFISVKTVQELKIVFQEKLIPLLQEYFYGDFGKIGLVLGNGFIVKTDSDNEQNLFAEFNDYDMNDLLEKSVYKIQEPSKMQDSEFISALKKLMRKND